mgnify:CR=1 FL=1
MKKEDINTSFDLDYKDEVDQKEYLQTKCKDCVFEILPKQCDFNIPNNINENKLILVKEEDNQDHYRINGFCKNFRPEIWKTANKGEDLVAVLEKENALNLSVIIKVNKLEDTVAYFNSRNEEEILLNENHRYVNYEVEENNDEETKG